MHRMSGTHGKAKKNWILMQAEADSICTCSAVIMSLAWRYIF